MMRTLLLICLAAGTTGGRHMGSVCAFGGPAVLLPMCGSQTLHLRGGETVREDKVSTGRASKESRKKGDGQQRKKRTNKANTLDDDERVVAAGNTIRRDSESEVPEAVQETSRRTKEPGCRESEADGAKMSGPRLFFGGVSCRCTLKHDARGLPWLTFGR